MEIVNEFNIAPPHILVIGCGNLLRGDDAVGPTLIKLLAENGVPNGVRLADAGIAGMDVAFEMAGVEEVIIVDACKSGVAPGEIIELDGDAISLESLSVINTHEFRFQHAIALGRLILKENYPSKVRIFLVEAEHSNPGDSMSPRVAESVARLCGELLELFRTRGLAMPQI